MKLSKYIMTLSGITALCLASVACTESIEYHPGAESHGPYFPLDVAPQQVLDDAGFFEVTVARTGNLAATSFEVTSNADPEIFTWLRNDSYANMMPYQEGFAYIEQWMKKYYEIPHEVEFRYK